MQQQQKKRAGPAAWCVVCCCWEPCVCKPVHAAATARYRLQTSSAAWGLSLSEAAGATCSVQCCARPTFTASTQSATASRPRPAARVGATACSCGGAACMLQRTMLGRGRTHVRAATERGAVFPCATGPPNMATTSAPETYRASIFLDAASKPTPLPTPAGMGFEDIRACLPKPGFGYAAGSAVICGQGWWSAGGDTNACTKCVLTRLAAAVRWHELHAPTCMHACLAAQVPGRHHHNGAWQGCGLPLQPPAARIRRA